MSGLISKVRAAFFWTIFGEIAVSGVRLLSYLVYAAFMRPEDYGIVGFALIFVQFMTVLTEQAVPMVVIHGAEEDADDRATMLLVSNLGLAVLGYALICLMAVPASHLLGDARVIVVLPVLGLRVFFSALSAIHVAVARRRLDGASIFYIRVFTTIATLAVSAPLAYYGYAYWALVAGMVAGGFGQMVGAWLFVHWPKRLVFDRRKLIEMYRFGAWTAMDLMLTWILMTGGSFVLGTLLGEAVLGKFRLTEQLLSGVYGVILEPLTPMVYSALAAANREGQDMGAALRRMNGIFCLIAIPMTGFVMLMGQPLEGLLGRQWQGTATILAINAVAYGVGYLGYAVTPYFRAIGRPSAGAMTRLCLVLVQLPAYFLAAPHGIVVFLWVKVGIEALLLAINDAALRRVSRLTMGFLLRAHLRLAFETLIVTLLVWFAVRQAHMASAFLNLLLAGIAFTLLMLVLEFRKQDSALAQLLQLMSQRFRRAAVMGEPPETAP